MPDQRHRYRQDLDRLPRPQVAGEVVDRLFDGSTYEWGVEMLHQQLRLQRRGTVVVDPGPLLERDVGHVPVVGVVLHDRDRPLQRLDDGVR